jgi:regulator of protease activity HflC (stomatin/prohibitin superfamily)
VTISIDAAVYYKVTDAKLAFYRIGNIKLAVEELTYSLLKNTCG